MARKAGSFSLQYVSMEEVFWMEPDAEPRQHVWKERLARIQALEQQRMIPTDVRGEIRGQRELGPGLRGVLFHEDNNPELISWGGLLRSGPVDVWMQIDGDLDREGEWAARLAEVAQAYRPLEAQEKWPVPGKDWFYLNQGRVSLPMKFKEEAQARFEGHPLGLKLAITTKTVSKVKKQGLMDRLSDSLALAGEGMTGSLVTQKYKSRKVAGLEGEELILRYTKGKKRQLYCLWTYAGEAKSGSHPKMSIEMESNLDQDDAKVAVWNQVLDSLRPAGL
ncbi:T6SS immunity protein Tli4 family protein [Archangium gephyra]|uniref:T6SS immunity protein Tli4 family protein n=1 Tax=Archangium gephyra TaxID=48 RepID=UPI003B7CC6F8